MNPEQDNANVVPDASVTATREPHPVPSQPTPAAEARAPQYVDPRRRLRELLSIPERDRTDEQWDEINELEIQLAPGNRVHPGQPGPGGMPVGVGRHFQQKKQKGDKGSGKRRPRSGGHPNKA